MKSSARWFPPSPLPSIERRNSNRIREERRGAALACENAWRASMPPGEVYLDLKSAPRKWKL